MNDNNKYFYMLFHKLSKLDELDSSPQAMWFISNDVLEYAIKDVTFNLTIKLDVDTKPEYHLCGIPVTIVNGTDIIKLMVEVDDI